MKRLLVLLALSITLPACGKPQPRAPEEVVREAETRKEPEFFDDLEMTKSQRVRVLALIDQLYADFAEYDRTRLLLLDETIAQIKSGQLDRSKLLPLAEVTINQFEKALPEGIAAMQRLHGILTREQREQLVALFTEGRKLTDEERRKARDNKYSKILGLTTGQKAAIYPSLLALYLKHWGTIGRFRSALHEAQDAFIEDHLVAKDLAIASDLELMEVGEVIFDALEIGMNHLTREQHATLAALLDSVLRSPNPTHPDKETAEKSTERSSRNLALRDKHDPPVHESASAEQPPTESSSEVEALESEAEPDGEPTGDVVEPALDNKQDAAHEQDARGEHLTSDAPPTL